MHAKTINRQLERVNSIKGEIEEVRFSAGNEQLSELFTELDKALLQMEVIKDKLREARTP